MLAPAGEVAIVFRARNLALIGSALLLVAAFLPISSPPGSDHFHYLRDRVGTLVFVMGAASALTVFIWQPKLLWLTGLGAVIVLWATYFDFRAAAAEVMASGNSGLSGNPFSGWSDLGAHSTPLEWGWAVAALGTLLIIVAAATGSEHG